MTDLSYKPKSNQEKDLPLGAVILAVMPFVILFWLLIEWGL